MTDFSAQTLMLSLPPSMESVVVTSWAPLSAETKVCGGAVWPNGVKERQAAVAPAEKGFACVSV